MDPAIHFAVSGAKEERAIRYRTALCIHPVIDPGNTGQVISHKIRSRAPLSSGKCDPHVREDISPVILYPGDDIFDNAFLVPAPFLAALTALPAVLV